MFGFDRRSLLAGAAAGFGGVGWAGVLRAASDPRSADLIVRNARIVTVDPAQPAAQAFAVRDGRFIAVGTNDRIDGLRGRGTEVYDAKGMTVVPGFIDTHLHPTGEMLLYDVIVGNPYEVEIVTIASIVAKLKERAATTPPGQWVIGQFYDDTKVKDGRPLDRNDLDQASTTHPVIVIHRGGHTAFVNSAALRLAGVTRETPDPFGGTFDRGPTGEHNGRVTDNALDVLDKVGAWPKFSPEVAASRARAGFAFMSKQLAKLGITSAHHEGNFSALLQIREAGELRHRVSYEAEDAMLKAMLENGWRTGFGDEWIRLGATREHQVDGSFSERTMGIRAGYPNRSPPYHGNVTTTQKDLDEWVEKVWRAGIQPNCHVNGDIAIDMYLTSLERVTKRYPRRDVRPKLTHATLAYPDLIARIRALDAVPACFSSYAYYNSDKFKYYGAALMEHIMPYRSYLGAGVRVSAGCDFPPGPASPLMAIQGMVTRTGWNGETWGPSQTIGVHDALRVYTANGAHNSHEEGLKGSISAGKLADYVILADDLFGTKPIKDIKVVRTVVGGRSTYAA